MSAKANTVAPATQGAVVTGSSMLNALQERNSKYVASETEVHTIKVFNHLYSKNAEQIGFNTNLGVLYMFKSAITTDADKLPQKFSADITLKTNKGSDGTEYVNVISLDVDLDSLSKRDYVRTAGLVVSID